MAWPSRTSICIGSAIALLVACGSKHGIAELKKADGPVDRQEDKAAWKAAEVGAQFYLGDAARTADGAALLDITGAVIAMQPHTILRFGGTSDASKISVELGSVDLTGNGNYGLDIGDVKLSKNGTLRITAHGAGQAETAELTVGEAQLIKPGGQVTNLIVGDAITLGDDPKPVIDAGVADAAAAPPDAAVVVSGDATIEVTGKKAEIQEAGATIWKPLPAGAGALAKGTRIRLGAGTTAKLMSGGLTLDLATGGRAALGDDMVLSVENGAGKASVAQGTEGKVTIPGGAVAVKSDATGVGETHVDVNARETKVVINKGKAKLTGAPGAELEMNRGESATLTKAGAIHPLEAIPTYFDFRVPVGESLTVHDPRPPTAVQFTFEGKCPSGNGVIELDHDTRFGSSKQSAGKESANLLVQSGGWAYRLRCGDGGAVASGRIVVLRDDGSRKIPKVVPENPPIDADGRNYTLSYQSQIPTLVIHFPGTGSAFKLHLASGGKEDTFDGSSPTIKVPSAKLHEGTYTYWFDHDGEKQPRVSSLKIDFDNTAPQVYIESPQNAQPFSDSIKVGGAVLPNWTAAVESVSVPIDGSRRFHVTVGAPPGNALAIRLSHPQRGVHYYLRRAK